MLGIQKFQSPASYSNKANERQNQPSFKAAYAQLKNGKWLDLTKKKTTVVGWDTIILQLESPNAKAIDGMGEELNLSTIIRLAHEFEKSPIAKAFSVSCNDIFIGLNSCIVGGADFLLNADFGIKNLKVLLTGKHLADFEAASENEKDFMFNYKFGKLNEFCHFTRPIEIKPIENIESLL